MIRSFDFHYTMNVIVRAELMKISARFFFFFVAGVEPLCISLRCAQMISDIYNFLEFVLYVGYVYFLGACDFRSSTVFFLSVYAQLWHVPICIISFFS